MKILSTLHIVTLAGMLLSCSTRQEIKLSVSESSNPNVEYLVKCLISPRIPKYPSGYDFADLWVKEDWNVHPWEHPTVKEAVELESHPQVTVAYEQLWNMGPAIFPAIICHLRDDRYSCSSVYNPVSGPPGSGPIWMNYSVGDRIFDLLSSNIPNFIAGYKGRKTKSGKYVTYPSFREYLDKQDSLEGWANWASSKTRKELEIAFLEWCIEREKTTGFDSEESEKMILDRYRKRIKKIEQDGRPPGLP